MKKIALAVGMFLAFSVAGFSNDGAGGWDWSKHDDAMTDQTQYIFLKMTVDDESPAIMLIYVPGENHWVWGLMRHETWTTDKEVDVTYRLGKEPAVDGFFMADRGRFYDNIKDLAKFLTYSTIVVKPQKGGQYKYDMTGLAKTIKMAGIK